ncbi:HD family phosphohydrolase [Vibrio sp. MACH09]|uniref:HD-GYP domain-containing protein n=1 Tax=Vibrio sp. MACH09 TaxID=3025122 RepID=UPI00278CB4DC|nr:HD-GYP domain-containing protein [Vibrio sp. MACH09]GLO60062.1 HD family phosphohydrolase [Vibrio sp. MACH09]
MQYRQEDSIKIAIKNVQIGMFVTAIEHSSRIALGNAGRVANQKGIQQLIDSEVKFVWVNVKLSSRKCTFIEEKKTTSAKKPKTDANKVADKPHVVSKKIEVKAVPHSSRSVKKEKAQKLIGEARNLAAKIMHDTFEDTPIDVGIVEEWADDVVDAVLVNPDAVKFVSALRSKDTYLLEHSVNVACLLVTFGQYLKLDKEILKQLAIGGMLHDIGKTKVKSKILNKPAKLTEQEFDHMKLHQVYAAEMIPQISGLTEISKMVCLMHHEKLDGKGYPLGLSGKDIPLYGRMSSIVDIYDALTAERCYKTGLSPSDAFKILLKMTPKQLDQDLVYKFINCISIYPVGSLVQLSDGKVGLVEASNKKHPLNPEVKCFYSNKYEKFIEVTSVHLNQSDLKIDHAISPSSLGIDISHFY